jgi:hypothetical protein
MRVSEKAIELEIDQIRNVRDLSSENCTSSNNESTLLDTILEDQRSKNDFDSRVWG